jgi:acyl-CoA reductase-like NAD-dependent aldehyde dehydrogenase
VTKTYKLYIGGAFPRSESGRYSPLETRDGRLLANVCRASRKDFREAVAAARAAQPAWASTTAYLRGQILYRIAEIMEGRQQQFIDELIACGATRGQARAEVSAAVDRLVYFAGWSDKYQQLFSSVNPVASAHFNFSVPEPVGVVAILAPEASSVLGLVANVAPVIVGGNSCIVLASETRPLGAISLGEVLNASDVPAGIVNLLTGQRAELYDAFASHMDVNALVYCEASAEQRTAMERAAAGNVKRVVDRVGRRWDRSGDDPYLIRDTQEIKTTWHPIGV